MAVLDTHVDDAFERLCREHRPALLLFCRARLGRHDAEDACQEALLRAYRALPTYDPHRPLWPWLATIAANVCTDMHRRRRADPVGLHELARHGEQAASTDEVVALRMRAELVGSAIGELPQQYRRPVWLADVAGWSYAQIARHERTTVASVRSSLLRGRKELRAKVRKLDEEGRLWSLPALLPLGRLRRLGAAAGSHGTLPTLPALAGVAAAAIAVVAVVVPGGRSVTGANADEVAAGAVRPSLAEADPFLPDRPTASAPRAREADLPSPGDRRRPGLLDGEPPSLRTQSTIDTEGAWRIVHVSFEVEHDTVPAEGGMSFDMDCSRDYLTCRTMEAAVEPLRP